jgi:cation diffusion facilitator CzcD-associated flavoprotein CzcO
LAYYCCLIASIKAPNLIRDSDVPAAFYSFSFAQNPNWSSFHPPGREIVQYYHEVCEKYQITDKIELNTDTEQCRWLEDEQLWEVRIQRMTAGMGDLSAKDRQKVVEEKGEAAVYSETEIVKAKVVLSCVGGLVEPRGWPDDIRGIENFQGKMFHSARWDETVDFTDKDVVVVGTGCSSAQLVPRLPEAPYNARSVTQLMRSPPWVRSHMYELLVRHTLTSYIYVCRSRLLLPLLEETSGGNRTVQRFSGMYRD